MLFAPNRCRRGGRRRPPDDRARRRASSCNTGLRGDLARPVPARDHDRRRDLDGTFAHADRNGSSHATAWGVGAFLLAGVVVPVYFVRYWLRKRRSG